MPSTTLAAPAVSARHPGAAARIANLIVDPRQAFCGIDVAPTWGLAFTTIVVLRIVSLLVFYRPAVTPLKLLASVALQVGTVAPALFVTGAVLWTCCALGGIRIRWATAFSIGTHAYLAYTLATITMASIAGTFLPAGTDVDLRHPPFTNLAPLASGASSVIVRRVLAQLDARIGYALLLTWMAVCAAAPRAGRARCAAVIAACAAARLVFGVVA